MLALLDQTTEPIVAREEESVIARKALEKLSLVAATKQDVRIVVEDDTKIVVPLPARAVEVFLRILEAMSECTPISVIPHEAELSTQQAADYLNVSRPYLCQLIDRNEIKHRMVGRHRRIKFADLRDYDERSRKEREAALVELASEAKRLDLD